MPILQSCNCPKCRALYFETPLTLAQLDLLAAMANDERNHKLTGVDASAKPTADRCAAHGLLEIGPEVGSGDRAGWAGRLTPRGREVFETLAALARRDGSTGLLIKKSYTPDEAAELLRSQPARLPN